MRYWWLFERHKINNLLIIIPWSDLHKLQAHDWKMTRAVVGGAMHVATPRTRQESQCWDSDRFKLKMVINSDAEEAVKSVNCGASSTNGGCRYTRGGTFSVRLLNFAVITSHSVQSPLVPLSCHVLIKTDHSSVLCLERFCKWV